MLLDSLCQLDPQSFCSWVDYRLEAIAQDAELEEFSKNELEQLGNELLAGCQKAQSEYEEKIKETMKKPIEDGKRKQVWF